MTADLYRTIGQCGSCADLSPRAKFRLTGADRARYLNGQVTNDVHKASKEVALHACVVNAKGRIEAEVFIHVSPEGDALMVDADPGLREIVAARLERYIVADEVTVEDVTEQWNVLHCFAGGEHGTPESEAFPDSHLVSCSRFGTPGVDLWWPASSSVLPVPSSLLSDHDMEVLRILRGIPCWPHELNNEAFPQESGLEGQVMDFAKGCYIGQEVLSRIKMTGKMPRVLRRFQVSEGEVQVEPGTRLMIEGEGGAMKEAGKVTSVAWHPLLDRQVGLAYVRQVFEAADSLLLACEEPPRILGKVDITSS
jgi:tRNA-modifying protein YgfZ